MMQRRGCRVNMQRALVLVAWLGGIISASAPSLLAEEPAATPVLWAGTGQAEITPPVGTPLAGYTKRHGKPSEGVDAPLYARALALRQGTTTVVLVSAELLIIDEPLFQAVTARVTQRLRAPPTCLLVAATHTHSGAGAYGRQFLERISMGAYDQRVFDRIADGIAAAAVQALEHLAPVEVGYGETELREAVQNRRDAAGPVDATLQVLAFRGLDGSWRALFVNFAAHPTALGASHMRFSGDYPGVLMRTIEQRYPGTTCLFTIGNLGDQRPLLAAKTAAHMAVYGSQLADAATHALGALHWQTAPTLTVEGQPLRLPPGRLRLGFLPVPQPVAAALLQHRRTRVTAIRVGDIIVVGYPGEPTARVGRQLKARLAQRGFTAILAALSDDYIGYVLTPEESRGRSYEADMNFFGPTVAQRLEDAVMTLVEQASHATARE